MSNYSPRKVCRILNVARSSYYYRKHHKQRSVIKDEERKNVERVFIENHRSFGRRLIKKLLQREGINYSERKIAKIFKELDIKSPYGRKKGKNVYTSESTEKYISENLFAQLSKESKAAEEIWSMDFTEQKTSGKKQYICGIISVTRKILVGYAIGEKCDSNLAITAINRAVVQYGQPYMIMTDRGSQFTSKAFYDIMQENNIIHSMSRPHTPTDNRYIETFWKTMKTEIGKTKHLTPALYRLVIDYYVNYYNTLRPHSSLNYLTPIEYNLKIVI